MIKRFKAGKSEVFLLILSKLALAKSQTTDFMGQLWSAWHIVYLTGEANLML